MAVTAKSMPVPVQILALVLGLAACGTPRGEERPAPPPASGDDGPRAGDARVAASAKTPWTDAFQKPAALLANRVKIEGPPGLIGHLATVSNADEFDRQEKTVPEGFLLVISVRPDAAGSEIQAQLDRLSIVALEQLTVLERTGPVEVVVTASGKVYWADPATGEERREESLRLEGKVPR